MPHEELIDQYVDRSSFRSDTDFILANLKEVLDAYAKLSGTKVNLGGASSARETAAASKALNEELKNTIKLTDQAAKNMAQQAKAAKDNAAAALLNAKAENEKAKAQANSTKETNNAAKAAAAKAKEDANAAKEAAKNQKVIDDALNDYLQLSKAYNEAALKAKNYALRLGEQHPVTIQAVKDAKAMYEVLYRVDQAVGQNQRNVGNYKSAFDGLGMSFTQIARELPSLTISVQQFILAISNNLPMAFDEIKKAKDEINALKAAGKEAPSIFQKVGAALLSWQVGLSVGIALLTAYGPALIKWIQGLFDSSVAAKEAAKQQQALNDQQLKGIEIQKQYLNLRDFGQQNRGLENQIAYLKAQGAEEEKILALELQLAKIRQETATESFNVNGGIKQLETLTSSLNKAKAAYDDFTTQKHTKASFFDPAFGKEIFPDDKEFKEREEQLKSTFDYQAKLYEDQKAVVQEYFDANRDITVKEIELEKNKRDNFVKFFGEELKYRAELAKALSEQDSLNQNTRVNARQQAYDLEKKVLAGQYSDDIRLAKGNSVQVIAINQQYNFERKKLAEELASDLLSIQLSSSAKQKENDAAINDFFNEEQEERNKKQIERVQKEREIRLKYAVEDKEIAVQALNRSYNEQVATAVDGSKKRQKIDEDYAKKRAEIEYKYTLATVRAEIAFAEQLIKVKKSLGIDTADSEQKLYELKIQLSDLETKHILDNDKKQAKSARDKVLDIEKSIQSLSDVYTKVSGVITGLLDIPLEKEKNALQDQLNLLEEKKQKDIEVANQTIANEQDKAAAIAVINARADAQQTALTRKQQLLEERRARYEKYANIGRIGIETALAVVHQLGSGDPYTAIGRAVAVGVLGAAQLAVAIATPLPKYKGGRTGGKAELAITGDGGKREVVSSPDLSNAYVTPNTDTLTYLPKDWNVYPDVDAYIAAAHRAVHKPVIAPVANQSDHSAHLVYAMAREIQDLKRAVLGKQETHFHWDNGQLQKAIKNGNSWTRYVQNRI